MRVSRCSSSSSASSSGSSPRYSSASRMSAARPSAAPRSARAGVGSSTARELALGCLGTRPIAGARLLVRRRPPRLRSRLRAKTVISASPASRPVVIRVSSAVVERSVPSSPSAAWRRRRRAPSSIQVASSIARSSVRPFISARSSSSTSSTRSRASMRSKFSSAIRAEARSGSEAPTGPWPSSTARSASRWSERPSIALSRSQPISKRPTAQVRALSGSGRCSSSAAKSASSAPSSSERR